MTWGANGSKLIGAGSEDFWKNGGNMHPVVTALANAGINAPAAITPVNPSAAGNTGNTFDDAFARMQPTNADSSRPPPTASALTSVQPGAPLQPGQQYNNAAGTDPSGAIPYNGAEWYAGSGYGEPGHWAGVNQNAALAAAPAPQGSGLDQSGLLASLAQQSGQGYLPGANTAGNALLAQNGGATGAFTKAVNESGSNQVLQMATQQLLQGKTPEQVMATLQHQASIYGPNFLDGAPSLENLKWIQSQMPQYNIAAAMNGNVPPNRGSGNGGAAGNSGPTFGAAPFEAPPGVVSMNGVGTNNMTSNNPAADATKAAAATASNNQEGVNRTAGNTLAAAPLDTATSQTVPATPAAAGGVVTPGGSPAGTPIVPGTTPDGRKVQTWGTIGAYTDHPYGPSGPPQGYVLDPDRHGGLRPWDPPGFDPTHGGPYYKPPVTSDPPIHSLPPSNGRVVPPSVPPVTTVRPRIRANG